MLSTLLLLVATPLIGNGQHGVGYAVLSSLVSTLFTALVALMVWQVIVLTIKIPFKPMLGRVSPKLARLYSDATDRVCKGVIVLAFACLLFLVAERLERLPYDGPWYEHAAPSDGGGGLAKVRHASLPSDGGGGGGGGGGAGLWWVPLTVSFQPWPACFFASFMVCNNARGKAPKKTATRWRLLLQPFTPYMLPAFGTLSGLWLSSSSVIGGAGLIAIVLFVLRFVLVWLLGLVTGALNPSWQSDGAGKDHRRQKMRGAGLDRVLQGPLALCVLWELQARCPALGAPPYTYASVGGALIFLDLLVGSQMLQLACAAPSRPPRPATPHPPSHPPPPPPSPHQTHLRPYRRLLSCRVSVCRLWLTGEMRVDKIGRACVLGAEGAPPVITLKLIDWEVRQGAHGTKCGKIEWRVRDFEVTDKVDEESVRRILLKARPDAFVAMMHDDQLNYDACELLQGVFDMPRCVVQCLDPTSTWSERFRSLGTLGSGGSGDVCITSSTGGSMSNILDRFVASPQSAIMLLHDDPGADVIKVTITAKEAGICIQDMKLPDDIQVLTIQRGKVPIVPHGHTKLQDTDEIMICGRPNSLASVTAMKKGKVVLVMGR